MSLDIERLARDYAPTLGGKAGQEVHPLSSAELAAEVHTGVMIALYPSAEAADQLVIPWGKAPDDIHLTLVYLGSADELVGREDSLRQVVSTWAATEGPLEGEVSGIGVFTAGEEPVTYASVDIAALPAARQRLMDMLAAAGFESPSEHGYTPHMTLIYDDLRHVDIPNLPIKFEGVSLVWAGRRTRHLFMQDEDQELEVEQDSIGTLGLHVEDRQPTKEQQSDSAQEPVRAFVTSLNKKTIITGQAQITGPMWDSLITPNPYMLWLQGRFVGADKPNRNNALWSASDLELSCPTVTNGPLNWLHESRHVIGTIADAKFVSGLNDTVLASEITDPHIIAASCVWRWIYSDEAYVIEQANDLGQLWYSMECIASSVRCAGENGCGMTVPYQLYTCGGGCPHMAERSAVRQFINPVFLGGAVIVPPTRPGWADADVTLMPQVAAMAEETFEQAGHPDVTTGQWEQIMAQILQYANN